MNRQDANDRQAQLKRNRKQRQKRLCARQTLQFESLEPRSLMAVDSVGVVRGASEWLLNTNTDSAHEIDVTYGLPNDIAVAGKWQSNLAGDMPGVVRTGPDGLLHWFLATNGDTTHDLAYRFGLPGDIPVVGDWNGDGADDVGVVRQQPDGLLHWYLNTDNTPAHEIEFLFGLPGDIPVVGNWNGDNIDDVGVARRSSDGLLRWFLNTDNDVFADEPVFAYGLNSDRPIAGDWDGDGRDNAGAIRVEADGLLHWYLDTDRETTHEIERVFGRAGDVPVVGNWVLPEIAVDGVFHNLPAQQIHFGIVRDINGAPIDRVIVVRNTGTAPLQLGTVSVPDGFQVLTGLPLTLAAGASAQLTVRMNTNVAGAKQGDVTVFNSDANESPFRFTVAGRVGLPEITVLQGEGQNTPVLRNGTLSFAESMRGETGASRSLIVRNDGNAPLSISRVSFTQPGFRVLQDLPSQLGPGATAELVVAVDTAASGLKTSTMTIVNNDTNEAQFRIQLTANVAAPAPQARIFGAEGSGLNFGNVRRGATAPRRTYTIQNTGSVPITLGNITLPSSDFRLVSRGTRTLAPGASSSFTVQMLTSRVGQFGGDIVVSTSPTLITPLRFRVQGTVQTVVTPGPVLPAPGPVQPTAPEIALRDAGGRELPTTGAAIRLHSADAPRVTLHVANTGTAPLTLRTLSIPSGFIVENFPGSVAPGGSASFTVRLGTTAGTFAGTLRFTTNDSNEGTFQLQLSGRKLAPLVVGLGTPSRPQSGVFEIFENRAISRIEVNPAFGPVPGSTAFVVELFLANGEVSKSFIDGTLTTLRLRLPPTIPVENHTGVRVEFLFNGVLTVLQEGTTLDPLTPELVDAVFGG